MKKFISIILMMTCFAWGMPAPLQAAGQEIVAEQITGEVIVTRAGRIEMAEEGMKFKVDDRIRTEAQAHIDLLVDGVMGYRLLGNSECVIMNLEDKIMHFEVLKGNLMLNIGKLNPASEVKVTTPTAVAGVRGTQFLVSVLGALSTIAVMTGIVDVLIKKSGQMTKVGAGKAMDVPPNVDSADIRDITRNEERKLKQIKRVPTKKGSKSGFGDATNNALKTPAHQKEKSSVETRAIQEDELNVKPEDVKESSYSN